MSNEGSGPPAAGGPARQPWTLFEPVRTVTYVAPEARAAFAQAGLRGFGRGYFAGRAAPLGPDATGELAKLLAPVARACSAVLPQTNPAGVPAPARTA